MNKNKIYINNNSSHYCIRVFILRKVLKPNYFLFFDVHQAPFYGVMKKKLLAQIGLKKVGAIDLR